MRETKGVEEGRESKSGRVRENKKEREEQCEGGGWSGGSMFT